MERTEMGGLEHPRSRRRLVRTLLLACRLTGTSLIASPISASAGTPAGIPGCILTAKKPGISASGLKAFGRFSIGCIVGNVPFQYQVAVWEKDDGPDTQLARTAWLDATTPSSGSYEGKGPKIACNTERGAEELYTRVRARLGGETAPWESSGLLTTRTCQQ